jgi:radical SAM-linked protein
MSDALTTAPNQPSGDASTSSTALFESIHEKLPFVRIRYRIRFAKTGLLRWIGHNDLIRLWERVLRRVDLPLSMSEGFHRRPRLAFPSALALGVLAQDEVVDLDLRMDLSSQEVFERLVSDDQPGLQFISVQKLPAGAAKAQLDRSDYHVDIPAGADVELVRANLFRVCEAGQVEVTRKGARICTAIPGEIPRLELGNAELVFTLVARDSASLRPDELLTELGAGTWTQLGATITRQHVHLKQEFAPSSEGAQDFYSTTTANQRATTL